MTAAYNEREKFACERNGETYDFRWKEDRPVHHEVMLPEGADPRLSDSRTLWNVAEAAEKRKDAQVAKEVVLALPADPQISNADRVELARRFAQENFVKHGLAVQIDVHTAHEGDKNHHAHLLVTTRRVEGDHLSAKKARDLNPTFAYRNGRALVTEDDALGVKWRDMQNAYFREQGLDLRVDPVAIHAGEHIGPVRMRAQNEGIAERADMLRRANETAARDPEQVLQALTRNNATFTERDLERFLEKHVERPDERAAIKAAVLDSREVLHLYDRESAEPVRRYTTTAVRDQELSTLGDGAELANRAGFRVSEAAAARAAETRTMRPDQLDAFRHATRDEALSLIEGRAGVGKSYAAGAIREAYEQSGYRVVGLAPTNVVAADMKADGFREAGTVHSHLFRAKNGRESIDRRTVLMVDEAGMVDSRTMGELLSHAREAGAKVVLIGDDRQLSAVERGGLYAELKERHGAAEISQVERQKVEWQRQAAQDLSQGRVKAAVEAFDQHGAIRWTQTQDEARAALVEKWKADTQQRPDATRFVFAYTNKDVDELNAALRRVRQEAGELGAAEHRFTTKHGEATFSAGDRVQFTDTAKKLGIANGNLGTVAEIGADRVAVRLDNGATVDFRPSEFQGFRHGYAGTIYKGQGKTLDQTYLYHSHHWRQASSYVALTRQRHDATIFVARETAPNRAALVRQMSRTEETRASVAFEALTKEAAATYAQAPRQTQAGERPTLESLSYDRARVQSLGAALREQIGQHLSAARQKVAELGERLAAAWTQRQEVAQRPSPSEALTKVQELARRAEAMAQRMPAPNQAERPAPTLAERLASGQVNQQQEGRSLTDRLRQAEAPRQTQQGPTLAERLERAEQPRQAAQPTPALQAKGGELVPAHADSVRDSLGRSLEPEVVRLVAEANPRVKAQAEAVEKALPTAYVDPQAARATLGQLVKDRGEWEAGRAVRNDPAVLGQLRGLEPDAAKERWYHGAETRAALAQGRDERQRATAVGRQIGDLVRDLPAIRDEAAKAYRGMVQDQLARDRVAVPALSERAERVLAELAGAAKQGREAQAAAARKVTPEIRAEFDQFQRAISTRFGMRPDEAVRTSPTLSTMEGALRAVDLSNSISNAQNILSSVNVMKLGVSRGLKA